MEKYDLKSILSASCGAAPLTGDIQKETCRKLGIPKLGQGIFQGVPTFCCTLFVEIYLLCLFSSFIYASAKR